jgi:hypothetical protein
MAGIGPKRRMLHRNNVSTQTPSNCPIGSVNRAPFPSRRRLAHSKLHRQPTRNHLLSASGEWKCSLHQPVRTHLNPRSPTRHLPCFQHHAAHHQLGQGYT